MVQKRRVGRGTGRQPQWLSRFFALALAFGVASTAQAAGPCDIAADGPSAYERVKARLKEIHRNSPSVDFPGFADIDATLDAECVVTLKGPYQFKQQGHVHFMKFEAQLARKNGAPMGWEIRKLQKTK